MVVEQARTAGHDVVVIARSAGVDLSTGAGLDAALESVHTVIDVSNIQTISKTASIRFFEACTRNLPAAEQRCGVRHHLLLSIVGIDRVNWGYYQGKRRQEELVLADVLRLQSLPANAQIFGQRGTVHPRAAANSTPTSRTETSHRRVAAASSRAGR
jgi:uncharacterized protein YbjT (DUF2867 family)